MMFKPVLAFGLILGSLLVLVPRLTTGYTVKLGDSNTFGEGHAEELGKGVPTGDDAFPDPKKGKHTNKKNGLTSEELYLDSLHTELSMTNGEIDAYLIKYGYLDVPVNGTVSESGRTDAIKEFQEFSRLAKTGIVDNRTRKHMKRARCGLPDPVNNSKLGNFDAKAKKWDKKHLTYRIAQYSNKLPQYIVREWTAKAFKMWSDVSQLSFSPVMTGTSDLVLRFTPKKHGDKYPFDGKGGTLAHAFYPMSGEIHLEEEEEWTVKSERGTNLLYVLVHEIGHSLGLGHSKADQAIMEPVYVGYRANLALNADDIAGIQYLYGKPKVAPPKPKPPTKAPVLPPRPKPPTKPRVLPPIPTIKPTSNKHKFPCPFRFEAIMSVGKKSYGFYRKYLFEAHPDGRVTGRIEIRDVYHGGPYTVRAAAHNDETGRTFLFTDIRVWRFTNLKLDRGFPKMLDNFIRAAVMVDGQLLAFSFTHIHYLDQESMEDHVDGQVEISSEYPDLPFGIKAAVSYGDGLAYILYTSKVFQINVYTGEIESTKPCSEQ